MREMVEEAKKVNWRCFLLGFLLFGTAIFIALYFKIETDDFPAIILIGILLVTAFFLIVGGCNDCDFLSKRKK
jgi:hypothetical protein